MEARLDVARVRGLFPALADGYVHVDGPGGALLPEYVARAVGHALRMPVAERGGVFPASGRAEALVARRPRRRWPTSWAACRPASSWAPT